MFQYICETGFLDDVTSRRIFREVVVGLQYIHGLNVGHRDLKCENILLDKSKRAKVGTSPERHRINITQRPLSAASNAGMAPRPIYIGVRHQQWRQRQHSV